MRGDEEVEVGEEKEEEKESTRGTGFFLTHTGRIIRKRLHAFTFLSGWAHGKRRAKSRGEVRKLSNKNENGREKRRERRK